MESIIVLNFQPFIMHHRDLLSYHPSWMVKISPHLVVGGFGIISLRLLLPSRNHDGHSPHVWITNGPSTAYIHSIRWLIFVAPPEQTEGSIGSVIPEPTSGHEVSRSDHRGPGGFQMEKGGFRKPIIRVTW